jgi:predicted HicB family RNase H-like nuclease
LPHFFCSFKLANFTAFDEELKLNEGCITYPSNLNQQENRIMKTAQYTKSLTVSLRPEVYDQIKRITDEKHISIGEWVRDAIETALSTIQQKEETMR